MTRRLDYTALVNPIDPRALAEFTARTKRQPGYAGPSEALQGVGIGCAVAALASLVLTTGLVIAGLLAGWVISDPGNPLPNLLIAICIMVTLALIAGMIVLAVWGLRSGMRRRWEKTFRLSGFAAANDLVYSVSSPNPQYPGYAFQHGSDRKAVDHLRSADGRFVDIGNFQYTVSNGKTTTTHHQGFMALHLDRRLPHMVLDATANGQIGSAFFGRDQVLSLEGDFNRYFTLYCPRQYERDAYYVFTPDLMALLIDMVAPFDVEIVDDWMFVYTTGPFPMTNPGLHERLFRIIDVVGAKTLRQTSRYVDDRIGAFAPNVVAEPGRRLKKRLPTYVIVLLVFLGAPLVLGPIALIIAWLIGMAALGS